MTVPIVSVVMSCYNGERFLRAAIDSVLTQTFLDFEFIVLDNASTDGTAAILASYSDPRLIKVKNDVLLDMCASFNKGHRLARGRYIAHLDADDIALPERLSRQVAFLDAHSDCGLVASQYEFIDQAGDARPGKRAPLDDRDLRDTLAEYNLIVHSSVTFRTCILEDIGHYPLEYEYAEDYAIFLKIASRSKIACLPEVLAQIRLHGGQISKSPAWRQRMLEDTRALLGIAGNLPGLSPAGRLANRRALRYTELRYRLFHLRRGRVLPAVAAILRGMWADPGGTADMLFWAGRKAAGSVSKLIFGFPSRRRADRRSQSKSCNPPTDFQASS